MFEIHVNGIFKGRYDIKNLIKFLNHQGYFDESIPKPSGYSNRSLLIDNFKKWNIGTVEFLDGYRIWRVRKINH